MMSFHNESNDMRLATELVRIYELTALLETTSWFWVVGPEIGKGWGEKRVEEERDGLWDGNIAITVHVTIRGMGAPDSHIAYYLHEQAKNIFVLLLKRNSICGWCELSAFIINKIMNDINK